MRTVMRLAALAMAAAAIASTPRSTALPNANVIVQRWTAALRKEFDAAPQYGYTERIQNDDGRKVYEVTMLYGTPYKRLIRMDGKALEAHEERKEERRLAFARAERARESPEDRAHRIADYRKDFDRAHRILEELPRAFQYSLRGELRTSPRPQYVLEASPRAGYDPPNAEAEVLAAMRGEFWIDAATYQLSRAVVRLLHPVTIEGFLATVQPGTEFAVEQRPVAGGIWLPTRFQIRSRSSILLLFHHHVDEDRTFFNYHRQDETAAAPAT